MIKFTYIFIKILNSYKYLSIKPFHIAEVLTVRQVLIFREHTVCHLETSGIIDGMNHLESKQVTLSLHNLQRFYRIDMIFTICIRVQSNQFYSNSIIQSFFVYHDTNRIILPAFNRSVY